MSLNVLITNLELTVPSGTTVYTRDLALELRRQGHCPAVYTPEMGRVGRQLESDGILVTQCLRRSGFQPHVIHGHHFFPTLLAVSHNPGVPAIAICHDYTNWADRTVLHPRVRRHFGVSRVCLERLVREGVPEDRTEMLFNFVDTNRFRPRPQLPPRPSRALLFSNYAREDTYVPVVADACRQAGLQLDIVGMGVGNPIDHPEEILGGYDIVFAKAKAAMEAMAVGTAVVLCGFSGVGPMVTSREFDALRPVNFGFASLRAPLRADSLLEQIARYDPVDAAKVRDLIRSSASLDQSVRHLVDVYREVMREQEAMPTGEEEARLQWLLWRERLALQPLKVWRSLSFSHRERLKKLLGLRPLRMLKKLLRCG